MIDYLWVLLVRGGAVALIVGLYVSSHNFKDWKMN
jgi:hypothetical protein